ncbi:MoaD family protein [Candidatus Bipolaricaulota bacterium]|nr:MoaD family protein [Candidatus Bipolaricaulota bacterium]
MSVTVEVKLFANFRDKAGVSSTEVQATTAGELIRKLVSEFEELEDLLLEEPPPEIELRSGVTVMLNGRNIRFLEGNETELEEDDTVTVFPPIGGG